jgi:hypothetical protein
MPSSPSRLGLSVTSALLAVLALGVAGCGTTPKADTFDAAVAAGERPVAMTGSTVFFGGELHATVTISRGIGRGTKGGKKGHKAGDSPMEGERLDEDSYSAYLQARNALGSPLPPITIRLKLQNTGAADSKVDIQEVNSELGNFAVDPEIVSLAPGQTGEPNPMVSQLGVTSDTIPMTVTLRMGGRTESHVISVVSVAGPDAANPANAVK